MRLSYQHRSSYPQPVRAHATLLGVPSGIAGVKNTLSLMRQLIRQYKKDIVIRQFALAIVDGQKQKNFHAEVKKLFEFVRDRIRYVKDVNEIETLQTPTKTLEIKQGDCDDKVMLLAALLESIGHPTRLVAVGFNYRIFSHVFLQTKIGHNWISLDSTEPVQAGWQPPNIISKMIRNN